LKRSHGCGEDPSIENRFGNLYANRRLRKSADSKPRRCADLNSSVRSMYPADMRLLAIPPRGSTGLPVAVPLRPFPPARPQRGASAIPARKWMESASAHSLALCAEREDQPDADFVGSSIPACGQFFQHPSNDLDTEIARLIELDPIYLSIYPPTSTCYFELLRRAVRSRTLFGSFSPAQSVSTIHSENGPVCFSRADCPTTTGRPRLSSSHDSAGSYHCSATRGN